MSLDCYGTKRTKRPFLRKWLGFLPAVVKQRHTGKEVACPRAQAGQVTGHYSFWWEDVEIKQREAGVPS